MNGKALIALVVEMQNIASPRLYYNGKIRSAIA